MKKNAKLEQMLGAVRNDRIQFATMRPPGSTLPTLDRVVVVLQPTELVALTRMGDVEVLERLAGKLKDPHTAWAAEVVLAAMTGQEADIVNSFATDPDGWWDSLGGTAHERWSRWLDEAGDRLVWDEEAGMFARRGR